MLLALDSLYPIGIRCYRYTCAHSLGYALIMWCMWMLLACSRMTPTSQRICHCQTQSLTFPGNTRSTKPCRMGAWIPYSQIS